jgi:hypothetical protein
VAKVSLPSGRLVSIKSMRRELSESKLLHSKTFLKQG